MVEDRRNVMKGKRILLTRFPGGKEDPLKKREDFAVSLRRKKKQEIIACKRKKMFALFDETNNYLSLEESLAQKEQD